MEHCCIARHYFFSIKKCGELDCTICRPPRCSPEDFEQLYRLPDPVPGEDLHYKSFEELYGKQTTEDHRPSLKNAKTKTRKGKMKTIKTKHTMPFCPSAARAKNVGIIVNCVECEKPRLLFCAKRLSEKDRMILQGFLETIFYTCGMAFHNTCDLAMVASPKRSDIYDTENDEADQENIDEEDDYDENEQDESEHEDLDDDDKSDDNTEKESYDVEDPIRELFLKVFINDSWTCVSQVEKPYYSAGIYPDVCIECGSLNVAKPAKGEHPYCSGCVNNNTSTSKKRLKWKQGSKGKGKCTKT